MSTVRMIDIMGLRLGPAAGWDGGCRQVGWEEAGGGMGLPGGCSAGRMGTWSWAWPRIL